MVAVVSVKKEGSRKDAKAQRKIVISLRLCEN